MFSPVSPARTVSPFYALHTGSQLLTLGGLLSHTSWMNKLYFPRRNLVDRERARCGTLDRGAALGTGWLTGDWWMTAGFKHQLVGFSVSGCVNVNVLLFE